MKYILTLILLSAGIISSALADVVPQTSAKHFKEKEATESLDSKFKKNGFVLYMRQGPADTPKPDQVSLNLTDCTKQRPLSELGTNLAAAIGHSIPLAGIPVGVFR